MLPALPCSFSSAEPGRRPCACPLSGLAEVRIGRGKSGTVELAEDRVSSSHAKLYPYGGDWRVCDLDSTNGTFLNGKRVREATLREGDVVMAGSYELLFSQGALHITGGKPGSIPRAPAGTAQKNGRAPRPAGFQPFAALDPRKALRLDGDRGGNPPSAASRRSTGSRCCCPVVASVVLSLAMALFTGGLGMILSVPMMLAGVLVTVDQLPLPVEKI